MALRAVGGWYKWRKTGKFHELVELSKSAYQKNHGWTACGIPIPKSAKRILGPIYGGPEKPCQNCVKTLGRSRVGSGAGRT